jgi:hypothetical protein
MRPHFVAALFVLLLKLQGSQSNQFNIGLTITPVNEVKTPRKRYDISVTEFRVEAGRLGRASFQIGNNYTCQLEVIRSGDDYQFRHQHSPGVDEQVRVYDTQILGQYTQHPSYRGFESDGTIKIAEYNPTFTLRTKDYPVSLRYTIDDVKVY